MYDLAPARQPAPGTELVERYSGPQGFGAYVGTDNYFLTPAGQAGIRGMGCPGKCSGVGAFMDGTGLLGTGLFTTGTDVSGWGVGEWAIVGLSAYMVVSSVFTTKRGYESGRRKARAVRKALAA